MADVSYYLSLPYTRILKRDEDGDVMATVAELDGCIAHGSDEVEALHNLREAEAAWLEAALDAGRDVPMPEVDDDLPSGKFVVRLPRYLHQKLNKLAKKDDVSLNQVMLMAVTEHVTRREPRTHVNPSAWQWRDTTLWEKPRRSSQGVDYLRVVTERGKLSSETGIQDDPHLHARVAKG